MSGDKQEKPRAVEHEPFVGFCAKAMPCLTDGQASCVSCLTIFFGGFGQWIAACMDENGCNCDTFLLGILSGLVPLGGWIYAIMWGCECKKWNKARNEFIAGGASKRPTEPLNPNGDAQ